MFVNLDMTVFPFVSRMVSFNLFNLFCMKGMKGVPCKNALIGSVGRRTAPLHTYSGPSEWKRERG